jgi:ferredoxin
VAGCPGEAHILIEPPGVTTSVPCGTTVLQAARDAGVRIQDECGGRGVCATCAVRVVEGELAAPGVVESQRLGRRVEWVRLACQARVTGDATVRPLLPLGG